MFISFTCFEIGDLSSRTLFYIYIYIYTHIYKVKCSSYRPGVAQTVGRGIALLFHDRGTRRRGVVSSTPRPYFTPEKNPVPILQEAGWATGPVWMGGISRPHRDSIPDRPARIQSLYQLSYPAYMYVFMCVYIYIYIYKYVTGCFTCSGISRLVGRRVCKVSNPLYIQPSSWRWTPGFETCWRHQKIKN